MQYKKEKTNKNKQKQKQKLIKNVLFSDYVEVFLLLLQHLGLP